MFQKTKERFETTTHRKQRARDARCGISKDYHPFDLLTGVPLESSEVQNRLDGHFKTLHTIVDEAKLSQGADNRIAKAERVLPSMIATIAFFWSTLKFFVDRLECSEEVTSIANDSQLCDPSTRWDDSRRTVLRKPTPRPVCVVT